MSEESIREEGFELFKTGTVRRLSPTHYVVKARAAIGWNLIELKDGVWTCDCNSTSDTCIHAIATRLHRYASKEKRDETNEAHLKCRYCSSVDIAGCGFRYGARGISRRYFCRDCQRKFSIPYVEADPSNKPNEVAWLLDELGMLISKLNELLSQLTLRLDNISSTPTDATNSPSYIVKEKPL